MQYELHTDKEGTNEKELVLLVRVSSVFDPWLLLD